MKQKYNSDIANSAAAMMQLPNNLEGILQEVKGQVEVTPKQETNTCNVPQGSKSTSTKVRMQKSSKTIKKTEMNPQQICEESLWQQFCTNCISEENIPKIVGKGGNTSFCKINKDILTTLRQYNVGGYTSQTLINAILRSFILHYKKEFCKYKTVGKSIL